MFRCDIGADTGVRDHTSNRRVVNDIATAVLQHQLNFVFHAKEHSLQVHSQNAVENGRFCIS